MNENLTLKQIKEECEKHNMCRDCKYTTNGYECTVVVPWGNDYYYPCDWQLEKAPYGYLTNLAIQIHLNAKAHGWWDDPRSTAEVIALCHSELSEALEEARNGNPLYYEENGKPEGIAVEMIDCVIRIFDYLAYEGVDVDDVLSKKMKYNEGRPYKHGKEF